MALIVRLRENYKSNLNLLGGRKLFAPIAAVENDTFSIPQTVHANSFIRLEK